MFPNSESTASLFTRLHTSLSCRLAAVYEGKKVTTLAGWSVGHLGPAYSLAVNPEKTAQINTIVLYDPGSYANFFERRPWEDAPCDLKYDQSQLYADWLGKNKDNRLIILAGEDTKDRNIWGEGGTHEGIQQALFPKIRTSDQLSSQVPVCNYDDMKHRDVLANCMSVMTAGPQPACPTTPVQPDTVWHP
ncbi:hypothetical protein GCM10017557_58800 [Streptomyces aurantiacus]|uniref:Alpha/beta hydrolase n=1 Tax=Streptomyces aurantiacus TaxID=47760 RepID=A0A7G1P8W4_9ACTN|nr:hypothetical protein GCM10017557_58800 [Streptomyces aurantiacus]